MKKTLNRFLRYWVKGNYIKMYRLCQKTWQHNHTQGELKGMLSHLSIEKFDIIGEGDTKEALNKVAVVMVINGERVSTYIYLICETAPYKPSLTGVWGVNPISILKKAKNV